jgi:hypothetical protein
VSIRLLLDLLCRLVRTLWPTSEIISPWREIECKQNKDSYTEVPDAHSSAPRLNISDMQAILFVSISV